MNNTQTGTVVPNQQEVPMQSVIGNFAPILLMIAAFYFLMIRPQRKQEAKKREMLSNLKKGNKVVMSNGMIGTIHKVVNDDEFSIEISEGVNVRILKNAVVKLLDSDSKLGKNLTGDVASSKAVVKKKAKAK